MKKSLVITMVSIAIVALFTVGFIAGSKAVINAPKWVEEDGGLYLVVTDFLGNEYVDIAEKPANMYNEFKFAYSLGRR